MGNKQTHLKLSDQSKQRFFIIGLLFITAGIVCNEWLFIRVSAWVGDLMGLIIIPRIDDRARIWIFNIIFVLIGSTLILLKFRTNPKLRALSDLSLGIFFTIILLVLTEGIFLLLNQSGPDNLQTHIYYFAPEGESSTFFQKDDILGYKLSPNLTVQAKEIRQDGQIYYDVVYTTDELGRRVTPVENPEARSHFILFFADSFAFGYGVNDNETLAAYTAHRAQKYRPYNYGISGHGPQQMLAKLSTDTIAEEINEKHGILVYIFLDGHINRAIGSMNIHNGFGDTFPYYRLKAGDQLVREGDLVSGRPFTSIIYPLIGSSQITKYYAIDIPRINDNHLRFTARIIAEARDIFRKKFNSDDFFVLLYPNDNTRIIAHLDEADIKYLNYSDLFSPSEPGLKLPDGHPSAKAYELIAEQLVKDLELSASN